MSREFEIRTRFRGIGSFDELLTAWTASAPFPAALHQAGDDRGWVFAPGASIRGCSATLQKQMLGTRITVRLSAAASQGDWRLAYALLRLAASRGATVRDADSDRVLAAGDLTDESAAADAKRAFRSDVSALQAMLYKGADEPLTLPNLRFSLSVSRADLPEGKLSAEQLDAFEAALARRTAPYRDARTAATIELRDGRTAAVWPGDAVLTNAVDLLIIPEPEVEEYLYLPWPTAAEILGDGMVFVQGQVPAYFIRAVEDDDPVWETLRQNGRGVGELSSP